MLNSRHIWIHQGSLTANDNGRKKFNKSEIRHEDEQILKWISYVNNSLFSCKYPSEMTLIVRENECDTLYKYTQLEHFSFGQQIMVKNLVELRHTVKEQLRYAGMKTVIAGSKQEVLVEEEKDISCIYLYEVPLDTVLCDPVGDLILPEVRQELQKKTLERIKRINEELEKVTVDQKVLVYGGGYQTEAFLRYANTSRLTITGIVDRKCASVFELPVKPTTYENIYGADVIVITPYYAANEIKKYLESLHIDSKIICLADLCGEIMFTGHENIWAPDIKKNEDCIAVNDEKEKLITTTEIVNCRSPYFVTVKENRAYSSAIKPTKQLLEFERKTALVLQGPVVCQQNFTCDTIRLYHENFPEMKLILSVWEDDPLCKNMKDVEKLPAEIVRVKKPDIRGYQNVNLQLATSYAGIKRAKELGCAYVFKTRTDMRFYSPDMLALMYLYMKQFPLKRQGRQKERLVIFPPRYDYYYFISDFFMFGNVDDMLHYWNEFPTFSNEYIGESAETMLGIRYAEYIGERVENNPAYIEEYDRVMKEYFVVTEDKMLDYVWYKYFYHKPWECEYHYNVMNFVDWLEGQTIKI